MVVPYTGDTVAVGRDPVPRLTKVKVLYIASWGRSGTTIVDNILNGYPRVFSAGELHYLWARGLVEKRTCGCGSVVAECELWRDVLRAAFGARPPDPREVSRLQRAVVRTRRTPRLLWRALPPEAGEYAAILGRLHRGIAEVTGAELVVDSSKYPAGAAILPRVGGIEAWLLHMVRDPRAVAYSWLRPTQLTDRARPALMMQHKPVLSTVRWLAWNALAEAMAPRYGERYRRLRYEDFVADPRGQLESLLRLVGLPADGGPFLDRRRVLLANNHTVSGNPGRFRTGDVPITVDDAWRAGLPGSARRTVTAIALPLLARYRYPLRPR